MAVQVSDFDRFSFTLFMALALHAIVVLGITFAPESPRSSAQTMEITLSQFDDETDPEEADFLAQTSQKGSGTEDEPVEMTTPQPSDVSQPEVAEVQPEPPSRVEPRQEQEQLLPSWHSRCRQASVVPLQLAGVMVGVTDVRRGSRRLDEVARRVRRHPWM